MKHDSVHDGHPLIRGQARLTREHGHRSEPLAACERVAKQEHGAQHGEKLPRRSDDGAGQRAEFADCHEDEILQQERGGISVDDTM